jgi:hypothetical protein
MTDPIVLVIDGDEQDVRLFGFHRKAGGEAKQE